ncbi:MAG: sensor domain-containing diguanylate cyclase [Candidatus Omnitrophota bacterium]
MMKDHEELLAQLTRAKQELSTLFEISNAMHKTLELEEILFIILTGVTSHSGLGFNRAMLLLTDQQGSFLEGTIGIGPDSGDEARRIWGLIDHQKMDLDDLVNSYAHSKISLSESKFFNDVKSLKIAIHEPHCGILGKAFRDAEAVHIKKKDFVCHAKDPLFDIFISDEFVIVPLKAKDNCIGLIVADNFFTRRAITDDDIRVLTMFANQAGLAIENSKLYEHTRMRSHKDALTDLWNHGYFQFMLDRRLRQAKDHMTYLSLILVDIDNFKKYNDTWGHQKGDDILIGISKILLDSSRKIDCVCRYGGEEFAVILPDASRDDTLVIAEKIRTGIAGYDFINDVSRPSQKITVSLGLASFPTDANEKSDLIHLADEALYRAKAGGKNRICSAHEHSPLPPQF